jgi:Arc/MetJ-type ribon-helix-helix transcriptional regulator
MNLIKIENVTLTSESADYQRSFPIMSSPYQREEQASQTVDDLVLRDDEAESNPDDRARTASSVRDIASRIPESLSAIGRDISRTIERAISAKDEYVVAVKISPSAQDKLDQLVQAGVFRNRAEAAGFLVDEGIKTQTALFERVQQKLAEIERLRAELRGMINETPSS